MGNVKIFFPQPPLRIDSFETKDVLGEKNRFLRLVNKFLSIRSLYTFSYIETFPVLLFFRHSYRNGTCLPIGMGPAFN